MLLYDVLPALSAKTVPLTLTLFHEYAEVKPDTNDKSNSRATTPVEAERSKQIVALET